MWTARAAREGGYKLNRTPAEYGVGDILRCIEDNLAPVSCIKSGSVCCEKGRRMHDRAHVDGA